MFTAQEKQILNTCQRSMPLVSRPFLAMAKELGVEEADILNLLQRVQDEGLMTRLGSVIRSGKLGASTLAAVAVPDNRLQAMADFVSGYAEVNHNYKREGRFNLWFVVAAPTEERLLQVLQEVQDHAGSMVLDLRMEQAFHIDLGFPL